MLMINKDFVAMPLFLIIAHARALDYNKGVVKATPLSSPEIQLTLQGQARSMRLCFDVHALGQVFPNLLRG